MSVVAINRCKRPESTYVSDGMGGGEFKTHGVVGDLIEQEMWGMDFLPRPGDLVTVHPDNEPSEKSWTGRVTGVQHVLRVRRPPLAVVTVVDES